MCSGMANRKDVSKGIMCILIDLFIDQIGQFNHLFAFLEDINELCVVRCLNIGQLPFPERVDVSF